MKIYVYAIAKNEEKFVRRWVSSMNEADGIFVLDTGSTDNTVHILRSLGVTVKSTEITPWRFDTARNLSLDMVPDDADLCVCTDIDEMFRKGWRKSLEKACIPGVKQIKYRYTWNFNPDGSEGIVFWASKVHSRRGFVWVNPVHEVLEYNSDEPYTCVFAPGVQLDHRADDTKSRMQYLPLLEMAVKENPDNDRNTHYLGREYMFRGMWQKCIDTLKHHLEMPSARWEDERCASMRYIALAFEKLGNYNEAERWHMRSVGEAPWLREPFIDSASFFYRREKWPMVYAMCIRAMEIENRPLTYISQGYCWGSLPYDYCALAAYNMGLYEEAAKFGAKALELEPEDPRLRENLAIYNAKIK